ncbi:MAG: NAD(P)-binding domain-containing protein [Rhodanobacter sp.]
MTYGIIGVGAIAASIVAGLSDSIENPPSIHLSPRNSRVSARLSAQYPNVRCCADNQAVVDAASTLILSLRPQDAPAVLRALHFSAEQSIVSVMAGISIEALGQLVAPATAIARTIPLPAVAQRRCLTPVLPPGGAAMELFGRLGGVIELEDARVFDAMSASTATIAAHFAYLGAIANWLVRHGLSSTDATRYVASMFEGLTPALQSGDGFDHLAQDHSTRGGTNELFLAHLTDTPVCASIDQGLDKVFQRLVGRSSE